jgi:hypothetical protein
MSQRIFLLAIAALFIGLVAHRVWRYGKVTTQMPAPVGEAREWELHLAPGGVYTLADIESNGRMTASQKYPAFQARHDFDPKPGDRLCPVSRTKASPNCTWTVAGRVYEFCCPPCIDEFVRLAKHHPDRISAPEAYVE